MKMFKYRIPLVALTLMAMLLLLLGGTAATPEPDTPTPVKVPVIFDGVRYEPEEFNRIHRGLYSEGVFLHFSFDRSSGELQAQTDEFLAKQGLPPVPRPIGEPEGRIIKGDDGVIYVLPPEKDAQSRVRPNVDMVLACNPPDSYYSKNYEDDACGGWQLWLTPNAVQADLRNVAGDNLNDQISSVQAATGVYREVLYKDINFGDPTFSAWGGITYVAQDLKNAGFHDEASSLWAQP